MSPLERTPSARSSLARAAPFLLGLLALAHAATFIGSGPIDDDFITFRYARNWVEGRGLVFNPGERFEGFTAPLWVLLMAGGLRLSVDPVILSQVVSLLAAGVAAFAIARVSARRWPGAWPVPALFVALSPALAWHAVAGLGTTLLAALLALWFDLYDSALRRARASTGAACCLALACLLRQEALLFVPFYLLAEWRRRPCAALALPLASLLGWTLFRRAYYGRWLPITYAVKKLDFVDDLRFGALYFWSATLITGVGIFLLTSLAVRRRQEPADDALRAARGGVWLHALYVVYVGGDFVALARFFVPTLPLFVLVGWAGLERLPRRWLVAVAAVGLTALQWSQLERSQRFGEQRFFEERWERLGRHFGATVPRDTRVAISPIGAFGWASDLPIVDILGLTNDAMLDRPPDLAVKMKGHQRFDAQWVLAQEPHFVILANGVRQPDTGQLVINPWEHDLYLSPRFQERYVHMRAPIPGDADLDVFRRADVAPLPGSVRAR